MPRPFAAISVALLLAAPAFAGFPKGKPGTMTGAQVRTLLKTDDNLFKDPESGRYFLLGNVMGEQIEKVLGELGDSGVLTFAADATGACYSYPGTGDRILFVEELGEGTTSRAILEGREDGAGGSLEPKA